MTESEFAFLALGLVLGIATGAALVVVLRSRPPSSEVRVTVTHDAVPRRGSTLSSDAFVTASAEPARGGPADRRLADRDLPVADPPPVRPAGPRMPVGIPIVRTPVPSAAPSAVATAVAVAVADAPLASVPDPVPGSIEELPPEPPADEPLQPLFVRMLHGDHRAMLAVIDELAGADVDGRRAWQVGLTALVEATIARSLDLGILHFPLGNPFWDTFTVEQCREIAGSLASMGYRFDGLGGWAEDAVPGYRELTLAVADAGLEPRRVRAWPNSAEIGTLCRGMRIAPEDLLAGRAPDLDGASVRQLLGSRGDALGIVWTAWERARPLLLSRSLGAAPA